LLQNSVQPMPAKMELTWRKERNKNNKGKKRKEKIKRRKKKKYKVWVRAFMTRWDVMWL
jgi:hypothetical protein